MTLAQRKPKLPPPPTGRALPELPKLSLVKPTEVSVVISLDSLNEAASAPEAAELPLPPPPPKQAQAPFVPPAATSGSRPKLVPLGVVGFVPGALPKLPTHSFSVDSENLDSADFSTRAIALLLDGAAVGVVTGVVQKIASVALLGVIGGNPSAFWGMSAVINFVALFFLQWRPLMATGQTLGKKLMKIKVVAQDGSPLEAKVIMKREMLGKLLSGITVIGYGLALGKQKLALHDRLYGSKVVSLRK